MRKSFVMFVAVALVAALAVPAMAEVNLTGFYRAKGYITNFYKGGAGDIHNGKVQIADDAKTNSYLDQRLRTKFTAGDENVKAVLFLENDMTWGGMNSAKDGGAISADGKDLEVKNAYVWFKVPDTAIDLTVGMQGVSDIYAGTFSGAADVAGVTANYKPSESLALKLGAYVPLLDNVAANEDGQVSFYQAEARFAASQNVKVGGALYFLKDTRVAGDGFAIYMPGVDFTAKLSDMVGLTGFAFYQFGDAQDTAAGQVDQSAFALDLRADVAAGPAKVFAEALYMTGDDDPADDKNEGVVVLDDLDYATGCSTCVRNSTVLIMPASDSINTAAGLTYNANNAGDGMLLLQAGVALPFTPKLGGKFNAAFAQAAKNPGGDKDMGVELNATLDYNVAKGLDTAVTAAYLFVGDYATGGATTDDPYALYAKVNYAF